MLTNGNYNILVRDIEQCGVQISQSIQTVTYPRYFTPNGDGFNEYWNIILFTTYATGKQRKGVMTKESHSTLLNTVMVSVPWPNIFGNISLNIISWHMPVSFWQTTYHGDEAMRI